MRLGHAYHIYADGSWRIPYGEHMVLLMNSGLLERLDAFYIGIVGSRAHVNEVRSALDLSDVPAEVAATALLGNETVTLRALQQHVREADAWLYTHTKGAANPHDLNHRWRPYLEHHSVVKWETAVSCLTQADVVSASWLTEQADGSPLPDTCHGFAPGNYWWATTSYLELLPDPVDTDRYAAERWIGTIDLGLEPVVHTTDGTPWSQIRV